MRPFSWKTDGPVLLVAMLAPSLMTWLYFVAYAGPGYAAKGDTVYYCVSDGKSPVSRPKPPVVVKPKPKPTPTPKTTPTPTPPKTTTPPKAPTPPKKKNPPKKKKKKKKPGPGPTDGGLGH